MAEVCAYGACQQRGITLVNDVPLCEAHGSAAFKRLRGENQALAAQGKPLLPLVVDPLYISVCDGEGVHPILPLRRAEDGKVEVE